MLSSLVFIVLFWNGLVQGFKTLDAAVVIAARGAFLAPPGAWGIIPQKCPLPLCLSMRNLASIVDVSI